MLKPPDHKSDDDAYDDGNPATCTKDIGEDSNGERRFWGHTANDSQAKRDVKPLIQF
jgi:hypothetical protein